MKKRKYTKSDFIKDVKKQGKDVSKYINRPITGIRFLEPEWFKDKN